MTKPRVRSRLLFAGKLALGLGLLAWLLLWDDNWIKVLDLFVAVRPIYLIPFIAISFVLIGISCLKWRLFLRDQNSSITFYRLFGLYLIGFFFNNFLPSNFGGDVARAYYLGKQIVSHTQSLASVFLERLTGLIALVFLAFVAYAVTPDFRQGELVSVSIGVLAAGCGAAVVALWHPSLIRTVLGPLERFKVFDRLITKLYKFHDHIIYFKSKPDLVTKAMGYSFLFHICTAINVYLAALVLGVELSLLRLMVVTPIILVIASLPLTPNSLGVWEWAFSVYLIPAGAELEQGLAVALLLRAKTLVLSLAGGVLYLAEDRAAPAAAATPDGQNPKS